METIQRIERMESFAKMLLAECSTFRKEMVGDAGAKPTIPKGKAKDAVKTALLNRKKTIARSLK